MNSFYLTTPIYYVNAKPHLGHAYTTIVADAMTRFQQALGKNAKFITGTDEHGDKIVQAAEKMGKTPAAFTDSISAEFRALWPKLEVEPASFIRTTDPAHIKVVQDFLQKVYDSGDIYFGEYGGYYCYGCERFYTEKELLESELCPQHLVKPEYISEKNYFFRMSKYQDWLRQYIIDNPGFIRPEQYRNEALGMLESGELEDLCISRPKNRLTWGVELPFDSDYVCYVWFDALLTYITALGGYETEAFTTFWPNAEHLIAKDILKPHAIFWPCMLKAAGLPLFKRLNVHGYWLIKDTKMSKSLGNIVAPLAMAEQYGIDSFRYFLLRDMHFGYDASFSEEALVARINSDLANDLGNLYSRVLSMTAKYYDSIIPTPSVIFEEEKALHAFALEAFSNYALLFERTKFSAALEALWEFVRALNKYVDVAAPWALAKSGDMERLGTVLYTLLEMMRQLAIQLWPVMPGKAEEMLTQLGSTIDMTNVPFAEGNETKGKLLPGATVMASSNLFPRIENERKNISQYEPRKQESEKNAQECISFDEFQKVILKIGTVLSCEQPPNSDKLYVLQVDMGEEKPRQILSGLVEFFSAEQLIGKQVVVVANLAPRKMRGLESHGMVLAVKNANGLELLSVTRDVVPGALVS